MPLSLTQRLHFKFEVQVSIVHFCVRDANENPFLGTKKIEVTARCGYRRARPNYYDF
jgi:hypothetical protein